MADTEKISFKIAGDFDSVEFAAASQDELVTIDKSGITTDDPALIGQLDAHPLVVRDEKTTKKGGSE